MCSETGFNPDKKSLFYIRLISVNQKIGFKYGITNKLDGNREKQQNFHFGELSLSERGGESKQNYHFFIISRHRIKENSPLYHRCHHHLRTEHRTTIPIRTSRIPLGCFLLWVRFARRRI